MQEQASDQQQVYVDQPAEDHLGSATDNYLNELSQGDQQEAQAKPTLTELEKLEKFTYKGAEWTPEKLERAMMRQSDYQKQMKAIQEEKRYSENLRVDLAKVRGNPQLADEFKRVYPEKYHDWLDMILEKDAKQEQQTQTPQAQALDPRIQEKLSKLDAIESKFQTWEQQQFDAQVKTHEQELASLEQEMTKKYPNADVEVVYARVQNLLDTKQLDSKDLTKETWDQVYKSVHDKITQLTVQKQKEAFQTAKTVNKKASDIGRGGGMPGQAPKKMNIRDATEALISDIESGFQKQKS